MTSQRCSNNDFYCHSVTFVTRDDTPGQETWRICIQNHDGLRYPASLLYATKFPSAENLLGKWLTVKANDQRPLTFP